RCARAVAPRPASVVLLPPRRRTPFPYPTLFRSPGGGGGTHHDRRWRSDAPGGCPGHDRPASDHSKNPAGTGCATQQYLHRHNRSHRASHVTAAPATCCKGLTFLVSCRNRWALACVTGTGCGCRLFLLWKKVRGIVEPVAGFFVSLCACCAQVMGVKPIA